MVLCANRRLESVVVSVGGVLLLIDAAEAVEVPQLVGHRNLLAARVGTGSILRIAGICAGVVRVVVPKRAIRIGSNQRRIERVSC